MIYCIAQGTILNIFEWTIKENNQNIYIYVCIYIHITESLGYIAKTNTIL